MVRDLVGASLLSGAETLPEFSVFSAATGSGLAGMVFSSAVPEIVCSFSAVCSFLSSYSIRSINSGFLIVEMPFSPLAFAKSFSVARDNDSYFSFINHLPLRLIQF